VRRLFGLLVPIVATAATSLSGMTAALAIEYHVNSAVGSDDNIGSAAAPFRTFARSNSALTPGDTLVVAPGHYTEPLVITKSGTPLEAITIIGNGRPLIEAASDAITISGSHVDLSGFEAHAIGLGSAITGKNSHHVHIRDNIARDSGCGGIALVRSDYIIVEDNRVFGNSRRSPWQCSGISFYQATNFDHAAGVHNAIRRNIVYDNMNSVTDEKISKSDGHTTDGNGIAIDDSRHTQGGVKEPAYDGSTLVENNIVFDNGGRGVNVFFSDHVVARNNTSYHNLKDHNLAWRDNQGEFTSAYSGDVKFINNIATPADNSGLGFASIETNAFCYDFNLLDGGSSAQLPVSQNECGSHNIFERNFATFVLPSVNPAIADFHLRKGSTAIGAGDVNDAPVDDFSGLPRPRSGPIDLGALQNGTRRDSLE
jgi:parallel beta-helix repeat protein